MSHAASALLVVGYPGFRPAAGAVGESQARW